MAYYLSEDEEKLIEIDAGHMTVFNILPVEEDGDDEEEVKPQKKNKKTEETDEEKKRKKAEYMKQWYKKNKAGKVTRKTKAVGKNADGEDLFILKDKTPDSSANHEYIEEFGISAVNAMVQAKNLGISFEDLWQNPPSELKFLTFGECEKLYDLIVV